jgi:hypothetical protein
MDDVELNGRKFRTVGKLNAFKQLHLFRRLLPILAGMGASLRAMPTSTADPGFWSALGPMAKALSEMSEGDSEWVLLTCLTPCQMWNGSNWANLTASSGGLMFSDLGLRTMLELALLVIQENLGDFFPDQPVNGSAGEAQLSPSAMPI